MKYQIEMFRKMHTIPNPNFSGLEVISHHTWEFGIVNEKREIIELGFSRYQEAENRLEELNSNQKQL